MLALRLKYRFVKRIVKKTRIKLLTTSNIYNLQVSGLERDKHVYISNGHVVQAVIRVLHNNSRGVSN